MSSIFEQNIRNPRKNRKKTETEDGVHDEKWPGCMVSGHIMVNRVPGNFHIEARSLVHSIDPTATNVRCAAFLFLLFLLLLILLVLRVYT